MASDGEISVGKEENGGGPSGAERSAWKVEAWGLCVEGMRSHARYSWLVEHVVVPKCGRCCQVERDTALHAHCTTAMFDRRYLFVTKHSFSFFIRWTNRM